MAKLGQCQLVIEIWVLRRVELNLNLIELQSYVYYNIKVIINIKSLK